MEPSVIITEIEKILGKTLHPAPARGEDVVSGVMPVSERTPFRYALQGNKLVGLNLAGAKLTDDQWQKICENLGDEIAGIQALNLRDNQLKTSPVPPEMKNLQYLDLCGNELEELTLPVGSEDMEHIWLYKNPELATPPPEIVMQGRQAIFNYFQERKKQGTSKIYEAKLVLIGDGRAGKTTLCAKLQNVNADLPPEDASTKGVEVHINKYQFNRTDGTPFAINIWDFAGQEKYQAIHQVFYTHRALYVLVENSREQKTDFNYWLETKNLCGDNSPVLIVHNEFGDQNRGQFRIGDYADRYAVVDSIRVNFATNRGLEDLKAAIHFHIQRLPHIGEELPKNWAAIRTHLNEICQVKFYLSLDEYFDLCEEFGIEDDKQALRLSSYLHILGTFLHYQDNSLLNQYVILRNDWATVAAYAILEDATIVFKTKGRFSQSDMDRIWANREYTRVRPQLLELMKKFKIAYQVGNRDLYIAPQLLPVAPPSDYIWPEGDDLCLQLHYGFMPKGLLTRFTVTRHLDIAGGQELAWKDGVVLEWDHTRAEVTELYADRHIHIRIQGRNRKGLMSIIDKTFDELHSDFSGIEVEKMIPCNCEGCTTGNRKRHFFRYSQLLDMKEDHAPEIQCGEKPYKMVNVLRLIDDVFVTDLYLKHRPKKIFISYSPQDEAYLKQLKTLLAPLKKKGLLETWDDTNLLPGEASDAAIRRELNTADVILFLVSPDLLATDNVWNIEMKEAFARHEQGDAVVVVPIIIRPSILKDTPFAKLSALPKNGAAISTWNNPDEAWVEVGEKLKKIVEEGYR